MSTRASGSASARKLGSTRPRGADEKPHRVEGLEVVGVVRLGQGRPSSGKVHSGGDAQADPGRHQQAQRGQREISVSICGAAGDQLLEVVEHEQQLQAAQRLDRLLERVAPAGELGADLARQPAAEVGRRRSRLRGRRTRRRRRKSGASSAIRRRARRVLPTPPGPTRLIRRQSSCASSSAMRRRSSERPTKPSPPASTSGAAGIGRAAAAVPTRLSCRACSSAPGARPRSSRRRPTKVR
jgi:hypothetical protein